MKDFTVSRLGPDGREKWHMYIGFTELSSDDHTFINCYGSALVSMKGKTDLWFTYWFGHTPDWNEITQIILKSSKQYGLAMTQLCEVASDIIVHIKDFISQGN